MYKNIINELQEEQKINYSKMINSDYRFFTKIVDKEELYKLLFLEIDYKFIDVITLQRHFEINTHSANKLFNLIIEYKVFTLDEAVVEANIDDPEEKLYFLTTGIASEDFMRQVKKIQLAGKKFASTL